MPFGDPQPCFPLCPCLLQAPELLRISHWEITGKSCLGLKLFAALLSKPSCREKCGCVKDYVP